MKKFKIKNRRKRKYIRKKELRVSSYVQKSPTIGLLSPFFLIIILLGIFMLAQSNIFRLEYNFNKLIPPIPAISLDPIYKYINRITLPAFSLPAFSFPAFSFKFSLPEFKFTLPEINIEPFIENLTAASAELYTNSTLAIYNMLLLLDPTPSIITTANIILITASEIKKTSTTIYGQTSYLVNYIILQINVTTENFILYITSLFHMLTTAINDAFSKLLSWIYYILLTFYSILLTVALSIKALTIALGNKIIEFLNEILTIIKTPFISLAKDIQPFIPLIKRVAVVIRESTIGLYETMQNTVKFISLLSQKTPNP